MSLSQLTRTTVVRSLAGATLVSVFAMSGYRAATQSIVFDEAYTYQHFVDVPLARVFAPYPGIANNHLINTLLSRATTGLLGPSELSLRLPSLVGGLFYLLGVGQLAELLFGPTALGLLCLWVLTLNPLLMDFMSVARGYGMALAFDVWALLWMLRVPQPRTAAAGRHPTGTALVGIGTLLALSTVANLAFLPVNASFMVVFMAVLILQAIRETGLSAGARRACQLLLRVWIPCAAIVVVAIVEPHLAHWTPSAYFVGVPTLGATTHSLVDLSLRHHHTALPIDTRSSLFDHIVLFVDRGLAPAIVALSAATCIWATWRVATRGNAPAPPGSHAVVLLGGTLIVSLAVLIALHAATGMLYPTDRTGLQFIVIASLLLCCFLQAVPADGVVRSLARGTGRAVLVALILQFCVQLNVSQYAVWRYDAATKRLVATIVARHGDGPGVVRLATSWLLGPSVNFYRTTTHLSWLRIAAPSANRPLSDLAVEKFDLYLVLGGDRQVIARVKPIPLDDDPQTGVLLAGALPRADAPR